MEATEYTVTFTANGKTIQRQELFDWSKEEDEQIRYYSEQQCIKQHSAGKESERRPTSISESGKKYVIWLLSV